MGWEVIPERRFGGSPQQIYPGQRSRVQRLTRFRPARSALIHLPISCALIAELQQAVLGVMPFAAVGTLQITAPRCSLAIIVFGNSERGPATARDQVHLESLFVGLGHVRVKYTNRRQHVVILSGIHAFACERWDGVEGPLHAHGCSRVGVRDCECHELSPWNR